jgi:hypothetical protein
LGKPQIGTSSMGERLKSIAELERLSAQTELYKAGGSGNQTLKLAQALMAENPNLSLSQALAVVKSSGTVPLSVENGQVTNLPGSVPAAAAMAGGKKQAEKNVDLTMNPQIKYNEGIAEQNAKSDVAANSTLPIIDQLRTFNSGTFEMPYADTAPVRGYSRIFGSAEQQAKQKNMDLLRQARTDLAAPLAKELGVNPTDRDFQATLDRIFDSNASRDSRAAQIDSLEQRILARKAARSGKSAPVTQPVGGGDDDPLGIRGM